MNDVHTMRVYESAAQTLAKIGDQVTAVLDVWNDRDLDQALRCARSANRQVTQLFNKFFGQETTISRDGDLSLFMSTSSGFVYGLIGHRIGRPDAPEEWAPRVLSTDSPVMGLYCLSDFHPPAPVVNGKPDCTCLSGTVWALPVPIEWSFHS